MKCSIIDRSTIWFHHLATLFSILLIKVCMWRWSRLAQALCKMRWNSSIDLGIVLHLLVGFPLDVIPEVLDGVAVKRYCRLFHTLNAIFLQQLIGESSTMRSCIVVHKDKLVSDQFLEENGIERMEWPARCREVIEADGGPINYWTLHSLWYLLKVKHRVTCNKWCLKVQKHVWFSCYSCTSWHKSQKCKIIFHTFCHKMHDFTPTMLSIGRHIPFTFCIRKFHIHYRLKYQNR